MKKFCNTICALASLVALSGFSAEAQTLEKIKYGDFSTSVKRIIKESSIIGGKTKTIYAIGPETTIEGAKAYTNLGGSPWATSNVYARVMGINKVSCSVFPDKRPDGNACVKLTTLMENVQAIGLINMNVLVSGSIFLGKVAEPITSSKGPYSKMEMGIPYTKRPKFLSYDYRVEVPEGQPVIYSSGFGRKKTLTGQKDNCEVYVILQRRWEDADGTLHAARVGTGRERFAKSSNGWVNGHQLTIHYGDITKESFYQPWMGLINGEKAYYAYNSKGKLVPVQEEKWDAANAVPTHVLVMASAGCGTAYTGTPGMTLWVDNFAFGF